MPAQRKQESKKKNFSKKSKDNIAELITKTFGSVAFLLVYLVFVLGWIAWNQDWIPGLTPFDSFPYEELEMVLSTFAIFLSVMVLISQKRQAKLEKIAEQVEFEVNLRSEKEITKLLEMLQRIQEKLGIDDKDPELDKMMENLDTEELHDKQIKEEGKNS